MAPSTPPASRSSSRGPLERRAAVRRGAGSPTSATNRRSAPMAMRTVGRSAGASSASTVSASGRRPAPAAARAARPRRRSTPPGSPPGPARARRRCRRPAPSPPARRDRSTARGRRSPRATNRHTARTSARCPASWRPAASRARETHPRLGPAATFRRDGAGPAGAGLPAIRGLRAGRRATTPRLGRGHPRKLTPPPPAHNSISGAVETSELAACPEEAGRLRPR